MYTPVLFPAIFQCNRYPYAHCNSAALAAMHMEFHQDLYECLVEKVILVEFPTRFFMGVSVWKLLA